MYNGIGLTSVRGTGTSGYVQTNKFNIRRRPEREERKDEDKRDVIGKRQANGEIIEHNRKREVEVKVYQYRVGLEDDGVPEDEIEARVADYRERMLREQKEEAHLVGDRTSARQDTHEIAARKEKQMEKIRGAFGFQGDIVEGEAFDRELQEEKKMKRIEEKEERERERRRKEKEIAREKKRRQKIMEEQQRKRRKEQFERHKAGYFDQYERGPERYDGDIGAQDTPSDLSDSKDSSNDSRSDKRYRSDSDSD